MIQASRHLAPVEIVGVLLLLVAQGCGNSSSNPPNLLATSKAEALVRSWLPAAVSLSTRDLHEVNDSRAERLFPDTRFLVLDFPQFPIATGAPAPLSTNNLFAVNERDGVIHMTDNASLSTFFTRRLRQSQIVDEATAARNRNAAPDVVHVWLRLSQELRQDGFYHFDIPAASIAVLSEAPRRDREQFGRYLGLGRAVVIPQGGNLGVIHVSILFEGNGDFLEAKECVDLIQGLRPVCQALKLLDPDPVVRKRAEQDLLIMGRSAGPYLQERRAEASPALRVEIDRVWQKIIAERR